MAKLSISRIFDTGKFLKTEAGQQLEGVITYLAEFAEQSLRAIRNGLTFQDNFDCEVKTVSLIHGTEQVISTSKQVTGVLVTRVVSSVYGFDSISWYIGNNGSLVVKVNFSNSPPAGTELDIVLIVLG